MSTTPYFKFYPSDFVGDTTMLSAEETGAYVLLLCAMWNAGGVLPSDQRKLALAARVDPRRWHFVWPNIAGYFEIEGERITHNRLSKEALRTTEIVSQRKAAGRAGGVAKSLKTKEAALANASDLPGDLQEQNGSTSELTRARSNTRGHIPEEKGDKLPSPCSEANASGADRAQPDLAKEAWDLAVEILNRAGMTIPEARRFFGKLLSENSLQAQQLLPALTNLRLNRSQDPRAYLRRAAAGIAKRLGHDDEPPRRQSWT